MHALFLRILACFAVVAGPGADSGHAQAADSLRDIIQEVSRQRSNIRAVTVSVTQRAMGAPGETYHYQHHEFALMGRQYFMEHEYAYSGGAFLLASTYDGSVGMVFTAKTQIASLASGVDTEHFQTKGSGFFDLLMYYPSVAGTDAPLDPADLLSLLTSEHLSVELSPADLDGAPCVVADLRRLDGRISNRIWIDPQRGCFPLRFDCIDGSGNVTITQRTTELAEIDGVWLPLQGTRHVLPTSGDFSPIETTISVDVDKLGRPLVSTNANIPVGKFGYLSQLPPGTMIAVPSGEIIHTVTADGFDANAKSALALADVRSLPAMAEPTSSVAKAPASATVPASTTRPTPSRNFYPQMVDRKWLVISMLAGMTAVIGVAVWYFLLRRR